MKYKKHKIFIWAFYAYARPYIEFHNLGCTLNSVRGHDLSPLVPKITTRYSTMPIEVWFGHEKYVIEIKWEEGKSQP